MRKFLLFLVFLSLSLPVSILASSGVGNLDQINQKVCNRLEEDVVRLSAIMEEKRNRLGIKETRVAFGGVDTPIKTADYWITFTAEAIAYQRAQKYSTKEQLRSNLEVLKDKVLRAKNEVRKALDD